MYIHACKAFIMEKSVAGYGLGLFFCRRGLSLLTPMVFLEFDLNLVRLRFRNRDFAEMFLNMF